MAVNVIILKTEDNHITNDDVNCFNMSMHRQGAVTNQDNLRMSKVICYTDDPVGLDQDINIVPLTRREEVEYDVWYNLDPHNFSLNGIYNGDKTMVLGATGGKPHARDMVASVILDSVPTRGSTEHSNHPFTVAEKEEIVEDNKYIIQQAWDWQNISANEYLGDFIGFTQGDTRFLLTNFNKDPAGIQKEYGEDIQRYIEDQYKAEGFFVMKTPAAYTGYYSVNNRAQNELYNQLFEENVRPVFHDSHDVYAWRGIGGDEEAPYLAWDHDWYRLSKQTSMIFFDDNPRLDRYCLLWLNVETSINHEVEV